MELLAPAGNLEKLQIAIEYGADAVYLGGERFGLRAGAATFDLRTLAEGVEYAHARKRKVYVTVNIFAHPEDFEGLEDYLAALQQLGVDAILVSDPGILLVARRVVPGMELHLSTQANCTNEHAALFWAKQGVSRIVLARELGLEAIRTIRKALPPSVSLEAFGHGAMCVSYSGRCLLSNFVTGHDANRGDCKQPCRWSYGVVEQKRPGEVFPVEQDGRGTYLFNSRDLCLVEYIDKMASAGVDCLKIEGRMKSLLYVATVTRVYRQAIDAWKQHPEGFVPDPNWKEELARVSERGFSTGFLLGKAGPESVRADFSGTSKRMAFIGVVQGVSSDDGWVPVQQRAPFRVGDRVEILSPGVAQPFPVVVARMQDQQTGEEMEKAAHPLQRLRVLFTSLYGENPPGCVPWSLVRKGELC